MDVPLESPYLTYYSKEALLVGQLVQVNVLKRKVKGIVFEEILLESIKFNPKKILPIESSFSHDILLSKSFLYLIKEVADFYLYSFGKLIFDIFPFPKTPPKREFKKNLAEPCKDFELTSSQKKIAQQIQEQMESQKSPSILIHGITGSGKSYLYLHFALESLKRKKSVLFLVPEINLTPQFENFFKNFLPVPLYSYHSGLTTNKRFQLYQELLKKKDDPYFILGVRSSIFLPLNNLGLIIIDEEHDASFKQEDHCPYQTKIVAQIRAKNEKIPLLAGSATPKLQSILEAKNDKNYFYLGTRANESKLPNITLVDAKTRKNKKKFLHEDIIEEIKNSFEQGEQVLVYINRLGHGSTYLCKGCGHVFTCPNCSTNLRYFKKKRILCCLYCEYQSSLFFQCYKCSCTQFVSVGMGLEKIVQELQGIFPQYSIKRFDRDELTTPKKIEERLSLFKEQKINLLVGTQILSKGHNFKNLGPVIVLGTDFILNLPDFQAREHFLQQLVQISGRTGRFDKKGRVFIQTHDPYKDIFDYLKTHEANRSFFDHELEMRKAHDFPPYSSMAKIRFLEETKVMAKNKALNFLQDIHDLEAIGPIPPLIEKKRGMYEYLVYLKGNDLNLMREALKKIPKKNYYKLDLTPWSYL